MRVTLIRHTSVAVPPGTCYGWSDVPLADTFEEEAETPRRALQAMAIDHAWTSPLSRARRLAQYCGFADATPDPRLREMHMGDWEMQRYDDIRDEALQRWYDDYMHLPATGGESFPMLRRRVGAFLDELRTMPYRHVAVFTHAGVIVAAGLHVQLYGEAEAFTHQPPYGGMMDIML
ncbi:MAG: alpha-ribazole phosphatase [Prevotella sp.]|nr:alpha-ribazole phosphatase [Prevotella sp.]